VAWWVYVACGAFGSLAVEALDFIRAIRRLSTWPWRDRREPDFWPYLTAVLTRVFVGAGVAWTAGASHQVSGPFGAFGVGVAALFIVEKLTAQIPVEIPTAQFPLVLSSAQEAPAQPGGGRRVAGSENLLENLTEQDLVKFTELWEQLDRERRSVQPEEPPPSAEAQAGGDDEG
jgi:hypothetical protein